MAETMTAQPTFHRERMPAPPDELIIYVNGEFPARQPGEDLDPGPCLHVRGRVLRRVVRRNGFINELDAHLDRLYRSVAGLKIRTCRCPRSRCAS